MRCAEERRKNHLEIEEKYEKKEKIEGMLIIIIIIPIMRRRHNISIKYEIYANTKNIFGRNKKKKFVFERKKRERWREMLFISYKLLYTCWKRDTNERDT